MSFGDTIPMGTKLIRYRCQMNSARCDCTSQFSQIEPEIGTKTRQLDLAAGQTDKVSLSGKRRIRDLLRTKTGKKLVAWKVLIVRNHGRDRFIRLSPPSVAK